MVAGGVGVAQHDALCRREGGGVGAARSAVDQGDLADRLARADQPDETFWAYTPKDSDVAAALRRVWNEAPRDFAQRLTVTVEAEASAAKTRQVRLAKVNHAGWRTPDAAALMVAGNP